MVKGRRWVGDGERRQKWTMDEDEKQDDGGMHMSPPGHMVE
jgi:hypothetical protein